jgi:hypothetical protein
MRVNIEHKTETKGLLRKTTFHIVALAVDFSDEEKAIIKERKLEHDVVLERDVPANVDEEKHAERGLLAKVVTAAVKGRDANHFHLTIGKLLNGVDLYALATPLEAKEYEAELKERLTSLKGYIMGNAGIEEKTSSFEL